MERMVRTTPPCIATGPGPPRHCADRSRHAGAAGPGAGSVV